MTKGFRIPGSAEAHDIAEKRLCAEISKSFKGRCFLLHQYVGMFSQRNGKKVYIGVKGIPDIGGWLDGIAFQIELKTGSATRTPEQIAFADMVASTGAVYIQARFSGKWCESDDIELDRVCFVLEQDSAARLHHVADEPL